MSIYDKRNEYEHILFYQCIVILAKELLGCGLQDLLSEKQSILCPPSPSSSYENPSKILIRMLFSVIRLQVEDVEKTMYRLIQSHVIDEIGNLELMTSEDSSQRENAGEDTKSYGNSVDAIDICKTVMSTSMQSIAIDHNLSHSIDIYCTEVMTTQSPTLSSSSSPGSGEPSYRKLIATQGIPKAIEMLKESPYLFAVHLSPLSTTSSHLDSIDESGSALLMQHVYMGIALYRERERNIYKYKQFLKQFTSGLPSTTSQQQKDLLLHSYPFSSQCLMALISVLFVHFETIYEPFSSSTSSHPTVSIDKAVELYEVLGRLPINTHAVTTLTNIDSPTSATTTITKKRLGYALFLQASSINHSCAANATVKYLLPSTSTILSSDLTINEYKELANHYLHSLQISILSTTSIQRDEEVCICYGPRVGKHAFPLRQQLLHQQYLFTCHCIICKQDLQSLYQHYQYENQQIHEKNQEIQNIFLSKFINKNVENVKHLCLQLETLKSKLEEINILFSEILKVSRISLTSNKLLKEFEEKYLINIEKQFNKLKNDYFIEEWKELEKFSANSSSSGSVEGLKRDEWKRRKSNDIIKEEYLWNEYCGLYCMFLDIYAHLLAQCPDNDAESETSIPNIPHFTQAANKITLAIHMMIFTEVYSEDDIVIARERVKLASLYMNTGDFLNCYQVISKALPILLKYADCVSEGNGKDGHSNSNSDPDLIQAQQLFTLTSRLLKFHKQI